MPDIDIGQISEALNDKMDLDSHNANPAVAKQSDLAVLQSTVSQLQTTVVILQGAVANMLGRIDYANGVSGIISSDGTYTIPANGYIHFTSSTASSSGYFYIKINEVTVTPRLGHDFNSSEIINIFGNAYIFPVSKDDVIKYKRDAGSIGNLSYTFYPQKS